MTDIKAILKQAKRPSTTVEVCLRGDLAAEYEQHERDLAKLPKAGGKLSGDPERARITAELDRLRSEMAEGTVTFTVRALPPADFQQLVDAHPPRRRGEEADQGDADSGFDRSALYRPLIQACVVEPTLDAEDWELLFTEALTQGQFLNLGLAALRVNAGGVDIPFSPSGSGANPA